MDFTLVSLGLGFLVLSVSFSYKLLTEVNIKKRAFNKSISDFDKSAPAQSKHLNTNDELMQRLEDFRQQRFAPKTNFGEKRNAVEERFQGR